MLDGIHKIHLIGIGGSGMRAIANILIQKGYDVSGSDVAESAVISKFREMGATVHIGHNKEYVNGVDAVVRSTAIREDNPEIVAAKEQGITILHRSDIVKAVLDVTNWYRCSWCPWKNIYYFYDRSNSRRRCDGSNGDYWW